jgi:hypothetical protein
MSGLSEGVFQTEHDYKEGADIDFPVGARYHPFSARTVLWEASAAGAVDLFIEVVDGDRVYEIDKVAGFAGTKYSWPNQRSPEKMDLVPAQRLRFRTVGIAGGVKHSVAITWAELAAP